MSRSDAPIVPPSTLDSPPPTAPRREGWVVLTGNPNCGKTTLFNALTGLRARVGNYPGVTVERKEGRLKGLPQTVPAMVLDLPGTYSLSAQSEDERIARDVLWQQIPEVPAPDLVVVVIDASNLERNLYYATQVIELGYPTLLALNMVDVAAENGHDIDIEALSIALRVPVIPMVACTGQGVAALRDLIARILQRPTQPPPQPALCPLPPALEQARHHLAASLPPLTQPSSGVLQSQALLLLTDVGPKAENTHPNPELHATIETARQQLDSAGIDWRSAAIEARYARVAQLHEQIVVERLAETETTSDRIDAWVTHRVWGLLIFVGVMALLFQSIFSFASWPMDLIESGIGWIGQAIGQALPPGDLNSLLVNGVVAGVGAVVVFLPQILLLFLFLGLLEDTGYMARGAFMMDRLMSRVGLHGKSFIPLLSSFACAIPGIMATRTIESPKDRLATILVAPLMSCSARLPVYTVLIAACVPDRRIAGFLSLQGLTLFGMYALGIVAALGVAWLLKRTLLKAEPPLLILELPPYRRPVFRIVLRHMWDRAKLFLRHAGTIILSASIVLWFLASYPRSESTSTQYAQLRAAAQAAATTPPSPQTPPLEQQLAALDRAEAGERLRESYAGQLGHFIAPVLAPLGFDWKIGIGIVASFAAREVFVSTMATIYNVEATDDTAGERPLADTLRAQERPDGTPVYTTRTALTLMVFYVFALQCVSTVAIVRRETGGWKWPLFQWLYMGALAWIFAFATYHLFPG